MRNPFARRAPAARVQPPRLADLPVSAIEHRNAGGFGIGSGFDAVGSLGVADPVSAIVAENASGVAACVSAIASSLASLPIRCYRAAPAGRIELSERDHWLPGLLKNPCPQATWPEWAEFMLASALLHGNALATIRYDQDGQPVELFPVQWRFCTPVLLEPSGELAFNVNMNFGPFNGAGIFRRYVASECVLLKDRSDYGCYIGRSRLSRSPAVLAAALGIGAYAGTVFQNAISPSGIISHPGKLNAEARTYLSQEITSTMAGPSNAKKTMVLDEGMAWTPISTSPVDNETLESRKFSIIEIARVFGVPPPIVQSFENNAFTSSETANRWFSSMTLSPWARKLEAVLEKSLLGDEPDIHCEIDFTALVRGDFAARWASYATAAQNKLLSVDEIRESEGYGPMSTPAKPVPGGEA